MIGDVKGETLSSVLAVRSVTTDAHFNNNRAWALTPDLMLTVILSSRATSYQSVWSAKLDVLSSFFANYSPPSARAYDLCFTSLRWCLITSMLTRWLSCNNRRGTLVNVMFTWLIFSALWRSSTPWSSFLMNVCWRSLRFLLNARRIFSTLTNEFCVVCTSGICLHSQKQSEWCQNMSSSWEIWL